MLWRLTGHCALIGSAIIAARLTAEYPWFLFIAPIAMGAVLAHFCYKAAMAFYGPPTWGEEVLHKVAPYLATTAAAFAEKGLTWDAVGGSALLAVGVILWNCGGWLWGKVTGSGSQAPPADVDGAI